MSPLLTQSGRYPMRVRLDRLAAKMRAAEQLLERIRAAGVGTSPTTNAFWQKELKSFSSAVARGEALDDLRTALGYRDRPLPEGVASNRELDAWAAANRRPIDTALKKNVTEHAAALLFLDRHKLLDDYVTTIDGLRVVSSMPLARHFWYAHKLRQRLSTPRVFLEIGAGGGQFAVLMATANLVRHYVIVDLPEMLVGSMLNIAERVAGATVHLGETPDLARGGPCFWFLDPEETKLLPPRSVDVAVNFNSFMELDRGVRDFYIGEVYRVTRPGGLFYNVNRRQEKMSTMDGGSYDNNPLLYPYRPSDRVLEWEPDEFQQSYRARDFKVPRSFCISRMAEVG